MEDTLRVVGVAGGAVKLLKFGKFALAADELRGGLMSYTPSSAAKALIQGSIKSMPTVQEVARGTSALSVRSPAYPGAFISQVVPNLKNASAAVEGSRIQAVEDVVKLVNQSKGPVLFSVKWPNVGSILGGGHTMMAYRPFFGSGLRLADQFGNLHTLEKANGAWRVIAGPGTTAQKFIQGARPVQLQAGSIIGEIAAVYDDTFVLKDSVLLDVSAALPLAQRVAVPLYTTLDDQFNWKLGYAASQLPTAPPKLKATGVQVKEAILANPVGTGAGGGTGTSGAPNDSRPPLSAKAKKLLSLLGPSGSSIDGKSLNN